MGVTMEIQRKSEVLCMRKLLCFLLVLTMTAALGAPALADGMDEAMTAVTLSVKETLDISDDYEGFTGSWNDWLGGRWDLYWSGEGSSINVTADAGGKVLEYWRYDSGTGDAVFYGFDPQFPVLDEAEAEKRAGDWLTRLAGEGETPVIERRYTELDSGCYRYTGAICLNGVDSPIDFTLRLDSDGELASYSRGDSYGAYVGEIPSAKAAVDKNTAAKALADTVELELYWVSDGEGSAALRYVPVPARHIVDAQSGECVDMEALYADFDGGGSGLRMAAADSTAAAESAAGASLTEVELASIAGYADVLDAQALDALLREIKELGLDGFTQRSACYNQSEEDGAINCELSYVGTMTDDQLYGFSRASYDEAVGYGSDMTIYKTLRVDARTGALLAVYTSYPLWEPNTTEAAADAEADAAVAEAFLKQAAPDEMKQSERCTLSAYSGGTVWAQTEAGYFYPENRLSVTVNSASGTIESYERVWDDDVSFGSARIIKEAAAQKAYIAALELTLGYTAWPVAVTASPDYASYADYGYTWVEELRLAWYYDGTDSVSGIDAVTGEAVSQTPEGAAYVYDDLAGREDKAAIERLGSAGVGLDGGKFKPDEPLDMRTAAILLLQAAGYSNADDMDDEALGSLCVRSGMIEDGAWKPEAKISRMAFLKMLLTPSCYGAACELSGVWQTTYEDWAVVAAADRGYAAVAQALGMADGDQLRPSAACTRGAAAQMLAAFMQRGRG